MEHELTNRLTIPSHRTQEVLATYLLAYWGPLLINTCTLSAGMDLVAPRGGGYDVGGYSVVSPVSGMIKSLRQNVAKRSYRKSIKNSVLLLATLFKKSFLSLLCSAGAKATSKS